MDWFFYVIILYFIFSVIFYNWWISAKFVAGGLRCSGSWQRRAAYYKKTWNTVQRLFLLPIILQKNPPQKRKSSPEFVFVFVLYYIFVASTVVLCGVFIYNVVYSTPGAKIAVDYPLYTYFFALLGLTVAVNYTTF